MRSLFTSPMLPRILLRSFVTGLFMIAALPLPVHACSCAKIATIEEELAQADVIFAGRVATVDSDTMNGKAKFMVSQVWRGSVPPIVMTRNLFDCMDSFREGEEYLVFAVDVREAETIERLGYQFVPSRCGQTRTLKVSQANLMQLGSSKSPRPFAPEESEMKEVSLKKEIAELIIGGILLGIFLVFIVRKLRKDRFA